MTALFLFVNTFHYLRLFLPLYHLCDDVLHPAHVDSCPIPP